MKTQVEIMMLLSECLETPPGISIFFDIIKGKWMRNNIHYEGHYYVTPEKYVDSAIYKVLAMTELVLVNNVNIKHWIYFYN